MHEEKRGFQKHLREGVRRETEMKAKRGRKLSLEKKIVCPKPEGGFTKIHSRRKNVK